MSLLLTPSQTTGPFVAISFEHTRVEDIAPAGVSGDRYVILSPYPGQPALVMATAWGNQLSVQSASDPRIAAFIEHFREGPQDLEHGAPCSGGVGKPSG